jgi:hypothetical protein
MKNILALIATAGLAAPALCHAAPAQSSLHLEASFDLVVHAPYAVTAPLFGPIGERAWAGEDWDPQFVHPQPGRDVEGAVFTVRHGTHTTIWVNTLSDLEARHVQYVYFLPELMVTVIDVRFKVMDADTTGVNVVYTRTALTAQGNEEVARRSEEDKTAGKQWQQAIDTCLASRKH